MQLKYDFYFVYCEILYTFVIYFTLQKLDLRQVLDNLFQEDDRACETFQLLEKTWRIVSLEIAA